MTTKIQPTNLDTSLNYSVNKLTVSGVDVLGYAQSAFLQANTSFNQANTGGTGGSGGTNNARSMINLYVFGS